MFIQLEKLAGSTRARQTLQFRCSPDFYSRAIYRHEARFLVAEAIRDGFKTVTQSKRRLSPVENRLHCEQAMFQRVSGLRNKGNTLTLDKHDACKAMGEAWNSRLEIAKTVFAAVKHHPQCDLQVLRGKVKRAQAMVDGLSYSCDPSRMGNRANQVDLVSQAATQAQIRKEVAEYAVNAYRSNGNGAPPASHEELRNDPVFAETRDYMMQARAAFSHYAGQPMGNPTEQQEQP